MRDGLTYLATPYSKHPLGLEEAFKEAAALAGRLLQDGWCIYSPIAHTHPVAIYGELDPLDHILWLEFDEVMMDKSDGLLVAKMEGWQESIGVQYEIDIFEQSGKPIMYLDPQTLGTSTRP